MAYSLRSMTAQQEMINDDRNNSVVENLSDAEVHDDSGSEYSVSSSSELAMEVEDATADQRILESRARGRPTSKLKGKNGFSWDTRVPQRTSGRISDVQPELIPGPAGEALLAENFEQFWDLLFDKKIIEVIVLHTNNKIEDVCAHLEVEMKIESYHHHTDVDEIKSFIGVLYYAGLWKSSDVDVNRRWDKKNGVTLYRCVFSRNRFTFLSSCLRFDDKKTRNTDDKYAPIREVWDIPRPSSECTVDEQLLSFRGRCGFRMYIKSKPDKYGLKLITLNDAQTAYLINAVPYLGKNSVRPQNEPLAEYFFREVTTPIHGSNRTVTCDNWFTSIPLLQKMLEDPYKMTITGTIRKNKRDIPAEYKVASKEVPATKFCHAKNLTLLSHTPKKNKIVLVVSSHLHTTEIIDKKPKIILHYNNTKGGTDTFDQLCHSYSVTHRTERWPVRSFLGMLDQAAVNARILLKCKLKSSNSDEQCTAITCLEKLYMYLITPHLQKRYLVQTLRRDIRCGIEGIIGKDVHKNKLERVHLPSRQRCAYCTRKDDKKTQEGCCVCEAPICDKHRLYVCTACAEK